MNAFVTGAYGLLGSWLVKALLDAGATVTALKRDVAEASALELEGTEARVNVVRGDVCAPGLVERALAEYGGGDFNRSRLVPEAVSAAIAGRRPVIRSDGTPQRDWLYVEDAVEAYLAIAAALAGGAARGEALNAGSGRPSSVTEMVTLICEVAGADVEPDIRGSGTPAGEIDRQWVDAGRIRELCGWEPGTELREGLRRTVEWYRAHPEALVPGS